MLKLFRPTLEHSNIVFAEKGTNLLPTGCWNAGRNEKEPECQQGGDELGLCLWLGIEIEEEEEIPPPPKANGDEKAPPKADGGEKERGAEGEGKKGAGKCADAKLKPGEMFCCSSVSAWFPSFDLRALTTLRPLEEETGSVLPREKAEEGPISICVLEAPPTAERFFSSSWHLKQMSQSHAVVLCYSISIE